VVQDESAESRPRPAAPRILLFTGVAGACALGAGLGLWARPSELERPGAVRPVAVAAAPVLAERRIPIVVGEAPAPADKPLDVLSRAQARPSAPPRPVTPPQAASPAPEMLAPSRPPVGLVRVTAPAPAPLAATPPLPARSDAKWRQAKAQAAKARAARAQAEKQQQAKLARLERQQDLAQQAAAAKAERRRDLARQAAADKAEHRRELAEQAAEAKAEQLAALKLRHERARAHAAELARAAAEAKARRSLTLLAHALDRLSPHRGRPMQPQRAEAAPAGHHRKSIHETRLARSAAKPRPARIQPPATPLVAKGAGPIRVANTIPARCASADPGEVLACSNPSLTAAERRLARAYRDAEAAGVPASTLALQQQRWKQARAAAAREAPWAVREVYQARIAELQDLVRDAKGE
jgi:colicin import membrane protein